MALNQISYPQPTSLQQLSDVLLKGSGDYANIQLQRQAEDRRRAQALADLQDQRRYSSEDRRTTALFASRLDALRRAAALGLISATDLGNMAIEDAALAKLAQKEATDAQRKDDALVNAQTELNQLASDRDSLLKKDQEIADRIRKLQEDYTATADLAEPAPITREAVLQKAADLARLARVKLATVEPKRSEQLAAYIGQAEDALQKESLGPALLAQQRIKSISSQYNSLVREQATVVDQVRNVRQTMADLQRQFPIAPVRTQAPSVILTSPTAPSNTPAPAIASPAEREAARRIAAGIPENPPPPPPAIPSSAGASTLAPATSIKGFAQRLPQIAPEFLAAPGRAFDTAGRYATAGVRGLWEGDFTVPQKGLVQLAGEGFGELLAPKIEPGDYMSAERAKLLGLRRSLDPLPPLPPSPQSVFRNSAFYP